MITASIITIGDELLIGQTIDTNSAWIAQEFSKIGLSIKQRIAIGDDEAEILTTLDYAKQISEIVIITGGLGPTSDDITKPCLCKYFDTQLELHTETLEQVKKYYALRNRPLLTANANQALLPANCTVLTNEVGTAPGMMFQQEKNLFFSLPGVPFEMKHLVTDRILPILLKMFTFHPITHKTLLTAGLGESLISERLVDFEQSLPPSISLAYLPALGTVKLRLTSYTSSQEEVETYFNTLCGLLEDITIQKEDGTLEGVISNTLRIHGKTLALAESCTGGFIAHKFTFISGASDIFKGSAVCYAEDSKHDLIGVDSNNLKKHTAISKEIALEMATNVREKYKADFSLATTGYLEGEETYFYCAVASESGTLCQHFKLPYSRTTNLDLASSASLQFLVKYIKKVLAKD